MSKTTEENKKRRSRLEKLKQKIKMQEKELSSKNVNNFEIFLGDKFNVGTDNNLENF